MADNNSGTSTKSKHGTSFDLCRMTGEVEGKKQWQRTGTVFIRGNSTGGVVYLKLADGTKSPDEVTGAIKALF